MSSSSVTTKLMTSPCSFVDEEGGKTAFFFPRPICCFCVSFLESHFFVVEVAPPFVVFLFSFLHLLLFSLASLQPPSSVHEGIPLQALPCPNEAVGLLHARKCSGE
jgi:hypothetical protein